jgi:O-acetylserine/cysteine efflux transporter
VLGVGAGASWALGNVLYKRVGRVDQSSMIAWLGLLAGVPSLALSLAAEGPSRLLASLESATWAGWAALAYLAVAATAMAWWLWSHLLTRHPASIVAPYALMVPVISAVVSWLAFDERFGSLRLGGMALIVAGLAIGALPLHYVRWRHGGGEP